MPEQIITIDIEDHAALLGYLRARGWIDEGEFPSVRTLAGGVSNRTVLVERATGEAWVLKQALEKLRVQVDWFSNPARIHREALGLRWLEDLAPPGTTTPLVFEDHDVHLLAMQAVLQPHENWKTMLMAGRLDPDHVYQFGTLLGTIHRRAYERGWDVAVAFDDRSFFESLRIEPYYRYTASQVPEAATFLQELVEETRASRLTLVHGDYSPKNILVHAGRLILLDHEVIHFGDPAFDLGFSLAHLLSKAHHLPEKRADFAVAAMQYWETYMRSVEGTPWGSALESRAARHTLGCLLARVSGRSTLEYLDTVERERQRRVAAALMHDMPVTMGALVDEFIGRLAAPYP